MLTSDIQSSLSSKNFGSSLYGIIDEGAARSAIIYSTEIVRAVLVSGVKLKEFNPIHITAIQEELYAI